jgi:alkylation response protein AidB-like acyl-CoA dehydrogenase
VRHILSHERVGAPGYALIWRGFSRALELLRQRGRFTGEAVRMRAAQCEAALAAGRLMTLRTVDRRAKGEELDETVNFAKYDGAEAARMVGEFLTDYAPDLILEDPLIGVVFRRGASAGIVAGATEVQLDLIARRVLNLPRGN